MAATLRVTRANDPWIDKYRRYQVFVNGKEVVRVKRGETLSISVPVGVMKIQAKVDWGRSQLLERTIQEGQTLHLYVGNGSVGGLLGGDTYLELHEMSPGDAIGVFGREGAIAIIASDGEATRRPVLTNGPLIASWCVSLVFLALLLPAIRAGWEWWLVFAYLAVLFTCVAWYRRARRSRHVL